MIATPGEVALTRVLAYLRLGRMPITREVMIEALALVQEELREEERLQPLIERLMVRLQAHFALPNPALPPVCPPLHRGSIQYED